jgi:hypothetical protein
MKKPELVLGLLIVVLGVGLFVLNRRAAEQMVPAAQPKQVAPPATALDVPLPSVSFVQTTPTIRTNTSRLRRAAKPTQAQTNQTANADNELQDPEARDALALVGEDSDADAYWLEAIFDDSLPDNERADLMEDLNEVGFDDPKNLTTDDLPMILSRLELIGAVLPNADPFMTEHLTEAQKDLSNMLVTAASPR